MQYTAGNEKRQPNRMYPNKVFIMKQTLEEKRQAHTLQLLCYWYLSFIIALYFHETSTVFVYTKTFNLP